jgi:hypothetical protein
MGCERCKDENGWSGPGCQDCDPKCHAPDGLIRGEHDWVYGGVDALLPPGVTLGTCRNCGVIQQAPEKKSQPEVTEYVMDRPPALKPKGDNICGPAPMGGPGDELVAPSGNKPHPKSHLFHAVYANVPLKLRSGVICIVKYNGKDEPLSWSTAYLEISNNTEAGYEAMERLLELKIIE